MTYAIVLREWGGPDKLLREEVPVSAPGPNQLRVRHTAIGVNFHDTYVRTGQFKARALPGIRGLEEAWAFLVRA
jgi:NADPH2:quinone reductase